MIIIDQLGRLIGMCVVHPNTTHTGNAHLPDDKLRKLEYGVMFNDQRTSRTRNKSSVSILRPVHLTFFLGSK